MPEGRSPLRIGSILSFYKIYLKLLGVLIESIVDFLIFIL